MAAKSATLKIMQERERLIARRGRPPKTAGVADAERLRILKAAELLFAREGYGGVSMRNVAKLAGCSPAALYNLFPNKRALLTRIWEDAFTALDRSLARADAKGTPLQRLRALGLAYVAYWIKNPDHFRALFLIEDRPGGSSERYFVDTSQILARVVQRFEEAAVLLADAQKIALKPREIVELYFCALHGVGSALIAMPEYRWQSRLAERMIDSVLAGFPRRQA